MPWIFRNLSIGCCTQGEAKCCPEGSCDCCTQVRCALASLCLETALRFVGNVALFMFYVLSTLNKWRESAECKDGFQNWFPSILWIAIAINVFRFLLGFSYKSAKSDE